jgi:hypothetical protein
VVGFVVAWRRPRNPLGWILLGAAAFGALVGHPEIPLTD